jgi:hypothetical protein
VALFAGGMIKESVVVESMLVRPHGTSALKITTNLTTRPYPGWGVAVGLYLNMCRNCNRFSCEIVPLIFPYPNGIKAVQLQTHGESL